MDELTAQPVPSPFTPARPPAGNTLWTWLHQGLRAGFLLRPRVPGPPGPLQLVLLVVLSSVVELGLARLEIVGPASFNLAAWLGPWWSLAASLLLVWALLARPPAAAGAARPAGVAAWCALWFIGSLPYLLLAQGLFVLQARELLPAPLAASTVFAWATIAVVWAWMVAVPVALGRRFGMDAWRLVVLAAGMAAIQWLTMAQFPERPWYADAPQAEEAPRLRLSQEGFERQQALWHEAVAALAPQRRGVRDVYGVVFAPYAREDVFLRESSMVAELLAQRFDAEGRVLHLVNHATTADQLPWATPANLKRAIEAIAQRMDLEEDVLVVYLTSHGASNFQLAAAHWPLQVETLSPAELRRMLDDVGIRHRVIAISACYSGGWIGPLASDTTLVMTAADAEHTSYGCGRLSELTFFGRAVFDEQLRSTHSFDQAFAAAVPVIRKREEEAHKADGFSNPQISMGDKIAPVLQEIAQRLDGAPRP